MRLAGNGQRSCRGSGPGARRPITADLVRCRLVAERAIKAQTTIHAVYLASFWPMNGCPAMTLPPVSPNWPLGSQTTISTIAPELFCKSSRRWPIRRHAHPGNLQRSPRFRPRPRSVGEVAWIAHSIHELMAAATAISAAVEQQAMTTRGITHPEGGGQHRGLDRNPVGSGRPGGHDCDGRDHGWTTRLRPVPRTSSTSSPGPPAACGGLGICATSQPSS